MVRPLRIEYAAAFCHGKTGGNERRSFLSPGPITGNCWPISETLAGVFHQWSIGMFS